MKKFIIATAISIIKSKPDNITTKDYCLSLQSRIKNGENSNITNDSLNFGVNLEEFLEISDLNCSVSTKDLSTQQLRKFGSSETKKRTQLNLQIIYAVREIKNMINYQKGTNFSSSQESFFESFMDSGFLSDKSQKYLNEGYKVESMSISIIVNYGRSQDF